MGAVGLVANDVPPVVDVATVVLIGWVVVAKVVIGIVTFVDEIEDDVGVTDGDVCDDTMEEAWTETGTDGVGVCDDTMEEAWTKTSVKESRRLLIITYTS